jgi:integrase/recombinase XerC
MQPALADGKDTAAWSAALVPYSGTSSANARLWRDLAPEDRRRRAVAAVAARDATTLWALTDAYLTTFGRAGLALSPYTRRNYQQAITRAVQDWKAANLLHPTLEEAAGYLHTLQESGGLGKDGLPAPLAPPTVKLHLAALRALYAALRWARATSDDPFRDLRGPRDPVPRWEKRKPYSDDEVRTLLRHAGPRDAVLVLLLAHAGLRIAEALSVQWTDVAADRRGLIVTQGKGGKRRTVPLSSRLADTLAAWRGHQDCDPVYVLPFRDRRWAWTRLKTLCLQAGVPPKGLHALRHTAGTRIVRQTGNLATAARLLGHSQVSTTEIYAKHSDEALRRVVEEW